MSFFENLNGLSRRLRQQNRTKRHGTRSVLPSSISSRRIRLEPLEQRLLLDATMEFRHLFYNAGTGQTSMDPMVSYAAPPSTAFNPAQIRKAYGIDQIFDQGVAMDGTGMTIAIINAYDNPKFVTRSSTLPLEQDTAYLASDLHKFCQQYGLPEDAGFFTKVNQTGGTTYPSGHTGWGTEIALDVEWVHAIAPGAKIVLVEANNDSTANLVNYAAVWARDHSGAVAISMSFGGSESMADTTMNAVFQSPWDHNLTWLAATGDNGSPSGYPAFSPNVVAVGGTTLTAPGGVYTAEVGWNGSGGSLSNYQSQPAYQQGLVIHNGSNIINANGKRANPDVSFNANPASGVAIYDSYANGSTNPWFQIGGTSFSAPAWAGLVAIGNQIRANHGLPSLDGINELLPNLYKSQNATDYHDITSGSNGSFSAGAGYDLVTGLGTPRAERLVFDLAGVSATPRIMDTTPSIAGGMLSVGATSLAINFNKTGLLGAGETANYQLRSLGADGLLGTEDDVIIPLGVSYSSSTTTLTFPALAENVYRLVVCDAIVDAEGNKLDGDNDYFAGGNAQLDFVVVVDPSLSFAPAVTSSSGGTAPFKIVTADFNGDGKLDLAVANNTSKTVGIRLGDGNGGFAAATTYNLGAMGSWYGMATADFNGDGTLDLVVTNNTGSTSSGTSIGVLLNNGKGSFWAPSNISSGGNSAYDVAVADFNVDGILDLAVTNASSSSVGILLGTGSGFSTPTTFSTGGNTPQGINAADFNGDGKLDLAIANYNSGTVSILLGNSNGTFAPATAYYTASTYPSRVVSGDFNSDGKLDLAVTNCYSSGAVSVLLGTGSGSFSTATLYNSGSAYPLGIVVSDLNGDGKSDLAVTHNNLAGFVGVLLGNGNGGFAAVTTFSSGGNISGDILQGDFNGDNRPDLVFANASNNTVGFLRNTNNGSFITKNSPHGLPFEIAVGTFGAGQFIQGSNNAFDGDGRLIVGGTAFQPGSLTYSSADGNQTLITAAGTVAGLTVSREITVPATGNEDFARTVDVFTNTTGSPVTTTVQIVGNLGSDGKTAVFATSDGTGVVSSNDLWIGTDDNADGSGTPAVIHYIRGPGGLKPDSVSLVGDNLQWTFTLTIPAGETVRLGYFTIVAAARATAVAAANALVTPNGFGGQAAAFLTSQELLSLVNFVNVNHAPLLSPASPALGTTDEETAITWSVGTLVNNGAGTTAVTDSDSGDPVGGIAITGTTAHGTWSYSFDGVNFLPAGTISVTSSLLLPSTALLRYQPDRANGETATFTYRAWDGSYCTSSMKADTTNSGGVTAFSAATDTATFTVTDLNDAPVVTLTPTATTIGYTTKDNPLTIPLTGSFINNGLGTTAITDLDSEAVVGGIAVVGLTGNGIWSYSLNGSDFIPFGMVSSAAALLLPKTAQIRYTPDGVNAETATINYRAWDATSGTSGAIVDTTTNGDQTAFSTAIDTGSVIVDMTIPTLASTSPAFTSGILTAGSNSISINFSEAMLGLATAANYQLRNAGADGILGNADDVVMPLTVTANGISTSVLSIAGLPENVYRLTAFDTLTDLAGNKIDGNSDGISGGNWTADFVVTNNGSVFPGPVSSFSAAGNYPYFVEKGDFNGDGNLDIILTSDLSNDIKILLSDGNYGFTASEFAYTGIGYSPFDLATGDFNGDGKLDVAVTCNFGNAVKIIFGDGHGGSGTGATYTTGFSSPYGIISGDFNGDGKLDLAVANGTSPGTVGILLNDGSGGFSAATTYNTGGNLAYDLAKGDFNSDGKLDLAVVNRSSNSIGVLLGTGNGSFGAATTYNTGGNGPYSIAVGDFSGDGNQDFAVANNNSNTVAIMQGNANGTFYNATPYATGGSSPYAITAGDFNGDGKLDIAVANNTLANVGLLLNNGSGGFPTATTFSSGGTNPHGITAGDFNGDGRPDLVVTNYSTAAKPVGILWNYYGISPVTLNSPHSIPFDIDLSRFDAGQLNQGWNNAFDGYGRLFVGGTPFKPSQPTYSTATNGEPVITSVSPSSATIAGLLVGRSVTVFSTGNEDFASTDNSFTNWTGSPITTTVRIVGNLGSDAKTMVFGTSDGTGIVGTNDLWIGTDDDLDGSGTPAIIHYLRGPGSMKPDSVNLIGDNIEWTYTISVPAGQMVTISYLTILAATRSVAIAMANTLVTPSGFGGRLSGFGLGGINFVNLNHAPVLSSASPNLGGTDEETPIARNLAGTFINNGSGTTTITDPDSEAILGGIAITGTTGLGTWSYSLDGATFNAFGTINATSALLLSLGAQIRYTPDSSNGETATFTYRAWDQTYGTAGMKADTTVNGGATAFSAATDTATLTVTSINDAPVLTPVAPSIPAATKDMTFSAALVGTFINNGIGSTMIGDVDSGSIVGGIAIVDSGGYGTWYFSLDGSDFQPMGNLSIASALLLPKTAYIRYTPDGIHSETATLSYRAWDTTSGTPGTTADTTTNGGATAFSTSIDTVSHSINDAPVLTPASPSMGTISEDAVITIDLAGSIINNGSGTTTITDPNANAVVGGIAITGITGRGVWSYTLDGSTFNPMGMVSDSVALLLPATASLRYSPDLKNGETPTITYRAWDATTGAAGGRVDLSAPSSVGGTTAFSTATDTALLTVTDANDAPVMVAASPSLGLSNSKTDINIPLAGTFINNGAGKTTITDVDNGATLGGIALIETTGMGIWSYSLDGVSFLPVESVSPVAARLLPSTAQLRYTPDGIHSETPTISYRAWDQSTGAAGELADASASGGTTAFSTATDTASLVLDYTAPTVANRATMLASGVLPAGTTAIMLQFSKPMANASIASNYKLQSAGVDGLLGTLDDATINCGVSFQGDIATLSIPSLPENLYRLTVGDTLVDLAGNQLDGDGDGLPGGSLTADFVVVKKNLFGSSTIFSTGGSYPYGVAMGDFNRDGKLDLAAANTQSGSVSVMLGNGSGGFSAATIYPTVSGLYQDIDVGDFNGDGKLDLAVTNYGSNSAGVLLGNGYGGFSAVTYYPSGGSYPTEIAAGDFNGDGKCDLVVSNFASNTIGILLADGSGGFLPVVSMGSGGQHTQGLAIGDFNGDTKADIAVTNWESGTVGILLGNGSGGFSAATAYNAGSFATQNVAVGDFNGDGKADLAVTSIYSVNNIGILIGDGNGGFATPKVFGIANLMSPWGIAVGDFNADGKADIAVTSSMGSYSLGILLGDGTGSTFTAMTVNASGSTPQNLVIGDFNNDGKPDVAIANSGSNNVSVLLNTFTPFPIVLNSTHGLPFDIATSGFGMGGILQGATNAFDCDGRLKINGTFAGPTATVYTTADGGQTLVTNPTTYSGLRVTRRITVPNSGGEDFARTVDVFANTSASDLVATVQIVGNLGSDAATTLFATSSGDAALTPDDMWFGTDAGGTGTAVIHCFRSFYGLKPTDVSIVGDNITWTYSLTVPAGQTRELGYFTIQAADRTQAIAQVNAIFDGNGFLDTAALGLGASDLATLLNFQFDHAPTGFHLTDSSVPEDQAGAVVGTLTTIDPDQGGTYTYSIALDGDPTGKFEIVGNTLKLKDGESLDFESMADSHVTLTIRTTDNPGGLSFEKQFTLTVADAAEQMIVGTSDLPGGGAANLTLSLAIDGKLHVYQSGTTTDIVPPHAMANVTGFDFTGRNADDVLTVEPIGTGLPSLTIHHGTLTIDQDDAISAQTNVTIDGGVLDFHGHTSPMGNLVVTGDGVARVPSIHNGTTTVESGTLTAASIVCDSLIIGMSQQVAASSTPASQLTPRLPDYVLNPFGKNNSASALSEIVAKLAISETSQDATVKASSMPVSLIAYATPFTIAPSPVEQIAASVASYSQGSVEESTILEVPSTIQIAASFDFIVPTPVIECEIRLPSARLHALALESHFAKLNPRELHYVPKMNGEQKTHLAALNSVIEDYQNDFAERLDFDAIARQRAVKNQRQLEQAFENILAEALIQ